MSEPAFTSSQRDAGLEVIRLGLWNRRIQNALAKEADLPVSELECMLILHLDRPMSASSLAELVGIRNSSLSKVLRRLEGRGLVERTVNREDRRIGRITLSAAGIALAERAIHHAAAIAATLLEMLPEERRSQFLQCVRVITSSKIPVGHQLQPTQHESPL